MKIIDKRLFIKIITIITVWAIKISPIDIRLFIIKMMKKLLLFYQNVVYVQRPFE